MENTSGIYEKLFLKLLLILFAYLQVAKSAVISLFIKQQPRLSIDPNSTITTATVTASPIKELFTNDHYIIRKSQWGSLHIWDIQTHQLLYQLFNGTQFQSTTACKQFDMLASQKQQIFIISSDNQILKVILEENHTARIQQLLNDTYFTQIPQDISITQNQLLILLTSNGNQTKIVRYSPQDSQVVDTVMSSFDKEVYRIKTCEVSSFNLSFYYMTIWKNDCLFETFKCWENGSTQSIVNFTSIACTNTDFASHEVSNYEIQWSSLCSSYIFNQRNKGANVFLAQTTKPFKVLNTLQNFTPLSFSKMFFTDRLGNYAAFLTTNGSYSLYNVNFIVLSKTSIFNVTLPIAGSFGAFSLALKQFFMADQATIWTIQIGCNNQSLTLTSLGICIPCPANCIDCNVNWTLIVCTACQQGYVLTNNLCIQRTINTTPVNTTDNTTQQNSNQTNNTGTNTTQQTSSDNTSSQTQTQDQTQTQNFPSNDSSNDQNTNQSSIKNQTSFLNSQLVSNSTFSYQKYIGSTINSKEAKIVIDSAILSINLLQLFPFSFLFMRFINFWSICSYYILLGAKMPQPLYELLKSIYQGISSSLLESAGIFIYFNLDLTEKFTGYLSTQYNLSSDFVNSNFQNFSILLVSYFILSLLYFLKSSKQSKNIVVKTLSKINYPLALVGQFVSIVNGFWFNLPILQSSSNQNNFAEKINIILQNIFIVLSICIFGVLICVLGTKSQPTQRQDLKEKFNQRRQWTICFLCNSVMPALAVFGHIEIFLIFSSLIFIYQTFTCFQVTNFRINRIILSFYPILFQIGFVVMTVFNQNYSPTIYHHAGLCLIIILFGGAVHQLLTFLFQLIYELFSGIKSYMSSVASEIIQKSQLMHADKFNDAQSEDIDYQDGVSFVKYIHFYASCLSKFKLKKKTSLSSQVKVESLISKDFFNDNSNAIGRTKKATGRIKIVKKQIKHHSHKDILKIQIQNLSETNNL